MRGRGLIAGAAVVIASNAIALLDVEWNRASQGQIIELTDRELQQDYQYEENSGIDLRLTATYPFYPPKEEPPDTSWLDAPKLRELGFSAEDLDISGRRAEWPVRAAYVAFEYDGPAWQAIADLQRSQPYPPAAYIEHESRLAPVDAAASPEPLLAKYGRDGKHIVLRATVQPQRIPRRSDSIIQGQVVEILSSAIHVPVPEATVLRNLPAATPTGTEQSRYRVRLAYGARFEPWIVSIER